MIQDGLTCRYRVLSSGSSEPARNGSVPHPGARSRPGHPGCPERDERSVQSGRALHSVTAAQEHAAPASDGARTTAGDPQASVARQVQPGHAAVRAWEPSGRPCRRPRARRAVLAASRRRDWGNGTHRVAERRRDAVGDQRREPQEAPAHPPLSAGGRLFTAPRWERPCSPTFPTTSWQGFSRGRPSGSSPSGLSPHDAPCGPSWCGFAGSGTRSTTRRSRKGCGAWARPFVITPREWSRRSALRAPCFA